MAHSMSLMVSFSQPERFIWHNDALNVKIPNGSRTVYHPRASPSQLKALLMPQLRLTRAGNISQHQPEPPTPQPYDFYLAQLIHYGLDFHFEIEAAQRALEIEIRLGRLRVPPSLLNLERKLEKAHKRAQEKAHEDAMRFTAEQQLQEMVKSAVAMEGSEVESEEEEEDEEEEEEEEKLSERSERKNAPRSPKRIKPKIGIKSSTESEEESSEEESSSTIKGNSDDESDTITVAPRRHESTASSDAASSTSSEEDQNAEHSIPSAISNIDNDASENDDDEEEDSSDEDPFTDRQDFKRIKLEKADEHEDYIKPTHVTAPFNVRKQPPPSQVKVRRIAQHSQSISQPINTAVRQALDVHSTSTRAALPGPNTPRKNFINPVKRPSWTIPVRASPSSGQKDTPKSVTFSQVQRETPSKVLDKAKIDFSSALHAPHGNPRRRTSSVSSEQTQVTPLRSILKKTIADPIPNSVPRPAAPITARPEFPVQLPHSAHPSTLPRTRRRKRKSRIGGEEKIDQDMKFDGTLDAVNIPEASHIDKPFITSDIVNGKPVASQQNGGIHKTSHRFSTQPPEDVVPAQSGNTSRRSLALNSNTYQQHQQPHSAKKAKAPLNTLPTHNSSPRLGSAAKPRLSLKGGASATPKLKKVILGHNGQLSGSGSGSRGSLVRAGQVY